MIWINYVKVQLKITKLYPMLNSKPIYMIITLLTFALIKHIDKGKYNICIFISLKKPLHTIHSILIFHTATHAVLFSDMAWGAIYICICVCVCVFVRKWKNLVIPTGFVEWLGGYCGFKFEARRLGLRHRNGLCSWFFFCLHSSTVISVSAQWAISHMGCYANCH